MKPIKESRFTAKKPEDIEFKGEPITDPPAIEAPTTTPHKTDVRPDEQTPVPAATAAAASAYVVSIPSTRRKTRHPFDIFEDQLAALKKIQLAESELPETASHRTLGEMAQEALDLFIRERAKTLPNINVNRAKDT